jgi:hypothetical protein
MNCKQRLENASNEIGKVVGEELETSKTLPPKKAFTPSANAKRKSVSTSLFIEKKLEK